MNDRLGSDAPRRRSWLGVKTLATDDASRAGAR